MHHGFCFDFPNGGLSLGLSGLGQGIDVVKDVGGLGDVEGSSGQKSDIQRDSVKRQDSA